MRRASTETAKGLFAIVVCALLWSSGGLFIKLADWHPMVIAGVRSAVAALFLLAYGRWRARRSGGGVDRGAGAAAGGLLDWRRRGYVGAALAYAATMLLFVGANKLTASANVILLQYSAPIFAALLGWRIAKEKPQLEHWLALAAVTAGMAIFFSRSLSGGAWLGDALALVSGVTFGAYSVYMRVQKDGRPEDSILLAHLIAAAAGLPFAFAYPPELSFRAVGSVMALGLFQIGVASLFFAYGIRRVTAVQAMLTAVVEPICNPVWVLLATGEAPGPAALAGGGIILAAVTASSIASARAARNSAPDCV
jgi:drug/metabolite transporter (DMT)-like permease